MKSPKISIIIPSYNKGKYIEETLTSTISQGYPNLEVIIQDGGSTDNTLKIIKKYAKNYPYLIWESKKDNGQTDAINKGLKKATGDILTYINADDIYLPGALYAVGKYFKKYPQTLWLAGKGTNINDRGKEISKLVTSYKNFLLTINHYSLLIIVNYLMQPSVFLSRNAYLKYGPFKAAGRNVMEYETWLKTGKEAMPKVINKYLAGFRLAKGTFSMSNYKKILKADDEIAQRFTDNILILGLHWLHNIARVAIAFVMNE